MKRVILSVTGGLLLAACVFWMSGCVSTLGAVGIGGGAATAGGVAYWVFNQPWAAKICYWIGDEAALTAMPAASKNVDADTIAVCADAIAFLQTAQNVPAATVNATLAASIAKLPPAQVAVIQEAAAILNEFLPATTSVLPLTANQLNDAVQFAQGFQDGTVKCMNALPAQVAQALGQATAKRAALRAEHPAALKAAPAGAPGWFCSAKK